MIRWHTPKCSAHWAAKEEGPFTLSVQDQLGQCSETSISKIKKKIIHTVTHVSPCLPTYKNFLMVEKALGSELTGSP